MHTTRRVCILSSMHTTSQSKLLSSVGFSFFDSDELEPPLRAATTPPVLSYIGKTPIEPQKPSTERRRKKGEERQIPPSSPALYLFSTVESISLSLSLSLSVSLCLSVNFSLYLSHARSELDNGFTPPALRRSIRAGVVRGLPPHCCLLGDGRCDQDVLRS